MSTSPKIKEKASEILAAIKEANSILLHLHPSPDPDSLGSALAMKFALEQLGKKATVIKGDSEIPHAFHHFLGVDDVVQKNFFEIEQSKYDLFIVQDSASWEMISRRGEIKIPETMKLIVIDHHATNSGYGHINLIDSSYPATAQVLHDLFGEWKLKLTPEIASNLFIGIYTDTGGLKYESTSADTYRIMSALVEVFPGFPKLISEMENTNSPEFMKFQGRALSFVEEFLDGKLAISSVPFDFLQDNNIPANDSSAGSVSAVLRTVGKWSIVAAAIQVEPNRVKASFRTKDANRFDVSKLAAALGGGGHKAAAGANLDMSLEDAKKLLVSKIKEMYNL